MPLDESLYQQHHRVLARIDQLGKGAASRLPPEAVAQQGPEAQLTTRARRGGRAARATSARAKRRAVARRAERGAPLHQGRPRGVAAGAARERGGARRRGGAGGVGGRARAAADARQQPGPRGGGAAAPEVEPAARAPRARAAQPGDDAAPHRAPRARAAVLAARRAARAGQLRAPRAQTVDGLLGGRRPLTSRPQTTAGEGEGISWERKSQQLEVANERLQTALAAATCGLDGRAPPSAAASPRGRGALCRGSPRARPGSFAPFFPA